MWKRGGMQVPPPRNRGEPFKVCDDSSISVFGLRRAILSMGDSLKSLCSADQNPFWFCGTAIFKTEENEHGI
jgi:hypothetical protein